MLIGIKEPYKNLYFKEVDLTSEVLETIIGGPIEAVTYNQLEQHTLILLTQKDGKRLDSLVNILILDEDEEAIDVIVGTAIFLNKVKANSLTDTQISYLESWSLMCIVKEYGIYNYIEE